MNNRVYITSEGIKGEKAFTLIEVMIAIIVLLITILGTSAYRYHAALSARRSDLYTNAARTALLLCEGWSGMGGDITFDPVEAFGSDLTIISNTGPEAPSSFTQLGSYKIVLEGSDYYATLSWKECGRGTDSFDNADKSYWLTTYVENPN